MNSKRVVNSLIFSFVILINLGCDQISKTIVRNSIPEFENIKVIENYVTLTRVENTGAFLSVGNSLPSPFKLLILTIFPLIALLAGFIFLLTNAHRFGISSLGLCFLIGGGLGNVYDRVVYQSVTDFLHVNLGFFQTGIFNMADMSIMTGVLIILSKRYMLKKSSVTAESEVQ